MGSMIELALSRFSYSPTSWTVFEPQQKPARWILFVRQGWPHVWCYNGGASGQSPL